MYKEKGVNRNCPRGGLAFLTFKERGGGEPFMEIIAFIFPERVLA